MVLLSSVLNDLSIAAASILSSSGYGVVFLGILLLMVVVMATGKAFSAKKAAQKAEAAPVAAPVVEEKTAPGSAGSVKIYDVPPKTAAMIMAIVAEKAGKPLNELRFISIKEVK